MDSLEARVSFNLHRLGLTGQPLRQAGLAANKAKDLSQGRLSITQPILDHIAAITGVSAAELTRPLDAQERASFRLFHSRQRDDVWRTVLHHAKANALSDHDLAAILRLDARRIAEAQRGIADRALTWPELTRLASHLSIDIETLLAKPDSRDR